MFKQDNITHETAYRFLLSALLDESEVFSCDAALDWCRKRAENVHIDIQPMVLSEMSDWHIDESQGRIRHKTGKFFSIDGIHVETNVGAVPCWEQPIINQPEIGFLGCIVKEINGILHFLVQAKIEPGNINVVQISPTLQATKSNFTQAHGGRVPKYLEYFNQSGRARILLDQLQSEQGARFIHKRNRNIIVEVDEDIPYDEDFRWLTLGQIKRLAAYPNIINMDLRTVISGILYNQYDSAALELWENIPKTQDDFHKGILISCLDSRRCRWRFDELVMWLTELKSYVDLSITKSDVRKLAKWQFSDEGLKHEDELFFCVKFFNVEISNREVVKWQQPLIVPREEGIEAFIVKRINGVYHFLVQAKCECGNFDVLEFAPTVQCLTGSYRNSLDVLPYLKYVLTARPDQVRFDNMLSEEGGRFYHEQNRNLIIEADDDFPLEEYPYYRWMTLNQMQNFIRFNNYLNIETRSLISCLRFL